MQNINFDNLRKKYIVLLEDIAGYIDKKGYSFEIFESTAKIHFDDFQSEAKSIREYLLEALKKEILYPLNDLDPLEETVMKLFGGVDPYVDKKFREYDDQVTEFSTIGHILKCLKDENGDYILFLHQFKKEKRPGKSKLTLKVEMKTTIEELKPEALAYFQRIWRSVKKHLILLAPVSAVLQYIKEGKCFEITWLVPEKVHNTICDQAPFVYKWFHTKLISAVWINDECVYKESIHGLLDMHEV